jgi:hypothetical protein
MFAQISVQGGVEFGYFNDINFCLMSFFPLLNSMSTLFFIAPYRNYLLKLLVPCWYTKFKRPGMSTSVAPGANPSNLSGI